MAEEVELCVEIGANNDPLEAWVEKADINQLCRACANTHENMIPIFEGDGLEHDLQAKIDKHFPINISKDDGLPHQMCFQCASTLVAWHDMYTGCIDAEKKLKNLLKKSEDGGQVKEEGFQSSIVTCDDLASGKTKSQRKIGSEMEVDDDYDDDDDDDRGDDEIETEEVVLHKLDAKKKENTVELGGKGTTIRDQCFKASSASVSQKNPERMTCSDQHSECVKRCVKKCLKIKFSCDVCGRKFLRQVCLLFHIKKMHENTNLYKCTECNAAFKCCLKYKMHVEQNHPGCAVDEGNDDSRLVQTRSKGITKRQLRESSKFLASLCGDQDSSMITDDDSHHSVGDSFSNDGELNFENLVNFDGGNTTNEGNSDKRRYTRKEQNITCTLCSESFRTTLTLIKHWRNDHTTEEAKSDPNYLKFNEMHTCNVCDQFYTNVRTLRRHKKNLHGIDYVPEKKEFTPEEEEQLKQVEILVPNGPTIYQCPHCGMNIMCGRRYLTHAARHNGLLPFCCEMCGKQFSKTYQLKNHIKIVHDGIREFKCELCGKEFGDRSNYIEHKRLHTGEKPFSCEICALSFTSRNQIYLHRRAHNNFMPHQCSECDRRFSRRQELQNHINRKHSTEKLFVCEICGKRFSVKDSLRIHMVTHSDARPHACSLCDRTFKRRKYLRRHMDAHHSLKQELFTAILQ